MKNTLHNKTSIYKQAGFTLVEMAIVVIISGFIFIPLMAALLQKSRDDRHTENVASNIRIVKAIDFFYKQNGRYPCPAHPDRAYGSSDFGAEDCTVPGSVLTGALPTKTLGLPFNQAINEYGWKYIYSVTTNLTDASTFDNVNEVKVVSTNGGNPSAVFAPFILVNPGVDGKGSYSLYGAASVNSCQPSVQAEDQENCDGDSTFIDAPIFIAASPTDQDYYDDTLSYSISVDEDDLWGLRTDSLPVNKSKVPLMTKTFGNVGIGADEPQEKLHIGGKTLLETAYNGDGGELVLQNDITVQGALTVDHDAEATTSFTAEQFCSGYLTSSGSCCYGEYITTGGGQCCPNGAFKDLVSGQMMCKENGTVCTDTDSGNVADASGVCCSRYQLDAGGRCCNQTGKGVSIDTGQCIDRSSTPSCTDGYLSDSTCCDASSDTACCPVAIYEGDQYGNCWDHWDAQN